MDKNCDEVPIHILEDKLVRYRWEETANKISGKTDGRIYAFPNIMMLTRKKLWIISAMKNLSDILMKIS